MLFISLSCQRGARGVANYVVGVQLLLRKVSGSAGSVGENGEPGDD